MPGREHAEKLWANLMELGVRRLVALALIGLATIATVGAGAYYLSRPEQTVLYTGLEGEDVTRIGSALRDAGIPFDITADGSSVMVSHAQTAKARMLLAEKGLPRGANSGYELFDELGSLGLTSFMQEVTRVRALEGELARTIQLMKGIRAARVHIVMPEKGSFRRDQQPPSASVVIRSDVPDDVRTADAIRHLVVASDGTVITGQQYHGPAWDSVPLLAIKRPGQPYQPFPVSNGQLAMMKQYTASIAIHSEKRLVAMTAPRGNRFFVWDLDTAETLVDVPMEDCAGVGVAGDGFAVTSGQGRCRYFSYRDGQVVSHWLDLPGGWWDNHLRLG